MTSTPDDVGDAAASPAAALPAGAAVALRLVPATLGLVFGAAYLVQSLDIVGKDATYPRIVATVVTALAAACLSVDLRTMLRSRGAALSEDDDSELHRADTTSDFLRIGMFVLALVAAVWLMPRLDFFLAAGLLTFVTMLVLGSRSVVRSVGFAVALSVVGYLIFVRGLQVPFPPGLFG